jgi:hypothetical protein
MTVPPRSSACGHHRNQGHADQKVPLSKTFAIRSLQDNNDDIFKDEQRMHSWRDRFLELCDFHGRDTERDGSIVLNILYTKIYQDKWDGTLLSPSSGLQQLQTVLLYIEKTLATSEAHKTGKQCVYHVDCSTFRNLAILRRLQKESPELESQHLHKITLSCNECAPLQPRRLFDDFPSSASSNAAQHKHLTLPEWQPPDEQLLDDANKIFYNTMSKHIMCDLLHDHTRYHLGRLLLLDAAEPVLQGSDDPRNHQIVYETVFHTHETSEQVTDLMRLKFHVSR